MNNGKGKSFHYRYNKPMNKEFRFYKACRNFYSDVTSVLRNCPKNFRMTAGGDFYKLARDNLYQMRYANSLPLGSEKRFAEQLKIVDFIDKIDDLIEPLERNEIISIGQGGEFEKKIHDLRMGFEFWMDSDRKQIEEKGIPDEVKDIRKPGCYS